MKTLLKMFNVVHFRIVKFSILHRIRETHPARTGTMLNVLSLTSRGTLVRSSALNLTAQLFPRSVLSSYHLLNLIASPYILVLSPYVLFSASPSLSFITFSVQSNSFSVCPTPFSSFFPSHCPATYSFIKCVTVLLSLPQTLQTSFSIL